MKWRKWWNSSDLGTIGYWIRYLVIIGVTFLVWRVFDDATLRHGIGTPEDSRWGNLVMMSMYGFSLLVALVVVILAFLKSRKLKKSTKGQWYDTSELTKGDLYDESSEAIETPGSSSGERQRKSPTPVSK